MTSLFRNRIMRVIVSREDRENRVCGQRMLSACLFFIFVLCILCLPAEVYADSADSSDDTQTEAEMTKPGRVTIKSVSASSKLTSVTVKWKKLSDADGYRIYRSSDGGETWTRVKTITSADTVKWKDTSVEAGKVYRYKIRAYKNNGGSKLYGSYSSVKKVKMIPAQVTISKISLK